jgi:protein-disulfide isomerase
MRHFVTAILALVAGFAGAALFNFTGLGSGEETREYLLANPEVLPEAMDVLQQRQVAELIDPLRDDLETPYPGAVLGNPEGSVTLVEFSDYACSFCRRSVEQVNQLIAANPDLRVVIREYPILSAESADAARMALAAAQQGRYEQFHEAMFEQGPPTPEAIEAAARQAGVDLQQARTAIETGMFDSHLQDNYVLAQHLGMSGTPTWVVGNRLFNGAQPRTVLSEAIEDARDG